MGLKSIYLSRKHTYIVLSPLNPTLYSKTGVYSGIHLFDYFYSKAYIVGTQIEQKYEKY